MRNIYFLTAIIGFLWSFFVALANDLDPSGDVNPPNKRVSEIYSLVYQIKTATDALAPKASYGSSFVVGKEGLLATNFHVVSTALFEPEAYRLYVMDHGTPIEAKVVAVDPINDLALVQVNREFSRVLGLAPQIPPVGGRIFSVGFPEDLNKSIIEGNFNGLLTEGSLQKIQMSMPLNQGMSGGPTVDQLGRLVGVNVSLRTDSQSLAFAVPASFVKALLKKPLLELSGPAAQSRFFEETSRQLVDLQQDLSRSLIQGKREGVPMLGWAAERPAQISKCWRESEPGKDDRPRKVTEICSIPNGAWLRPDVELGRIRLRFMALSDHGLTLWQYLHLANQEIRGSQLDTVDFIPNFTTKFHCEETDLVNAKAVPLRVHYCFSGYLRYPGLYNLELRAVTLSPQYPLFQAQLSLTGYTVTNALEISRILVDSMQRVDHP